MTLKVAFQMDPMESIDIAGDSSFALALEAQERGHKLFHYEPKNLSLSQLKPVAKLRPLTVQNITGNHFSLGEQRIADLKTDIDVILMRQDPPFDMHYISATHYLERIHPETLVVNDPGAVRNAPEKIFPTLFDGLLPPTLMTRDREALEAFRAEFGDVILKPLFGNGGAGVFRLRREDENFGSLVDMFLAGREPVIAQQYLPDVRAGDKRVPRRQIPQRDEKRLELRLGAVAALAVAALATDADLPPERKVRNHRRERDGGPG